MRRIDFTTLRLFCAIADEQSLTKAAEREHLALAAVSKRISDLEDDLSIQLLYRLAKGVSLTPAGDALLHHARNVLMNIERLDADLSEYSRGVKGHIRMCANTSSIIQFLPEDLSEFVLRHPTIKIDLKELVSTEIVRAVREGVTDIGIYSGHIAAEGLQKFSYRRDQLMLIAPPNHPLTHCTKITLRDIAAYDLVALDHDASIHSLICQTAGEEGIGLRIRIQARSFDAICRMIEAGLGVGILPDKVVQSHTRSMRIVSIAIEGSWTRRRLSICVRDYKSLSVIARQMVDHLSRYGSHPKSS